MLSKSRLEKKKLSSKLSFETVTWRYWLIENYYKTKLTFEN
jgi:hypothetical protein